VLPGPNDDAVIDDTSSTTTVTMAALTVQIKSVTCSKNLMISNSTVDLTPGPSSVTGSLLMANSSLDTDDGAAFIARGMATIDGSSLSALGGSQIVLAQTTSYDGSGTRGTNIQADGVGSRIDLSQVTAWRGAGGPTDSAYVYVHAMNGAIVDLSHVPEISVGNSTFTAERNGQINLSALTRFTVQRDVGLYNRNYLSVTNGGQIIAPALTTLSGVGLGATGDGVLPTSLINSFTNGDIYVQGGGAVSLPALMTYDGSGGGSLTVTQTGSRVDLSHVMTWKGAGSASDPSRLRVGVSSGTLDLRGLTEISMGNSGFLASAGGQINLSGLLSFTGAMETGGANYLEADDDGQILAPGLTTLRGVNLILMNGGALSASMINSFTNGDIRVLSSTMVMPALTIYDGSGADRTILVNGSGSRLDLSHVTTWRGAGSPSDGRRVAVRVYSGVLDLHLLPAISTGNTAFIAAGATAHIDLSGLTTFAGPAESPGFNFVEGYGGGTITLSPVTTAITNVTVELNATSKIIAGTLHLDSGSSLTGAGTIQGNLVNDGQIEVGLPTDLLSVTGNYTQISGTLSGPGTLTVNGSVTWAGGTMSGFGITNANGGLSLTGSDTKSLESRTLNDSGTGTWTGTGDLDMSYGAALHLLGPATLDIQNDQSITNTAGTATLTNAGILRKSAGTDTTAIDAVFSNSGTLQVQAGTMSVAGDFATSGAVTVGANGTLSAGGDYNQTGGTTTLAGGALAAGGTINLRGGVLSGSGTLNGTVNNGAEIDVGTSTNVGILTINGDYMGTGTLVIKIGGPDPSLYDQLMISGNAAFAGGTLRIIVTGGYRPDPTIPDSFQIISFGSHDPADDFAVYSGTDLGGGLTLASDYSDTGLTLVATQSAEETPSFRSQDRIFQRATV
jgi:hypothetical protein